MLAQHDVYISYSEPDRDVAYELVSRLEAHGIECWIAPRDLAPAAEGITGITSAIVVARVLVLVLSVAANDSTEVRRDVMLAIDKGVRIVPFRIANVLSTGDLEFLQYSRDLLDAFPPPIESHYATLCTRLNTILDVARGPPDDLTLHETLTPVRGPAPSQAPKGESAVHLGLPAGGDRDPFEFLAAKPRAAGAPQARPTDSLGLDSASLVDEDVQFTVYRPRQLAPSEWQPLLVFAHLVTPSSVAEVRRRAEAVLQGSHPDFEERTQDAQDAIPRGEDLRLVPVVPGIEFEPAERKFVWRGSMHLEMFLARALPQMVGQSGRGKLSVFWGAIVIAEVPLTMPVTAYKTGDTGGPRQAIPESGRRFRRIFASYSHKDSAVVSQFERYAQALGDEYLLDVTSLRAGEIWSEQVQRLIGHADIFQLFWSWNSLRSKFVRTEWEYALQLDRSGFVRPVYWEEPLPSDPDLDLPPESLRCLHFQRVSLAPTAGLAKRLFASLHDRLRVLMK